MLIRKIASCLVAGICLAGCASTESVRFQALAQQESLVRDGRAALVSKKQNSIVMISPAGRQMQAGRRPVYVVGLYNKSGRPLEFRVADISVTQIVGGRAMSLPVVPYEQLVQEERTRQVMAAVLVGAASAANAYSANRSYRPGSLASAVAQNNAAAENDAMVSNAVVAGQANMAALEQTVMKDNTLLPGEWYGGQLHFAPPEADAGGAKTYKITIPVGADVHEVEVTQGAATT